MEIVKASVIEENDIFFIKIDDPNLINIPISENDSKEVKKAFNKLLLHLKKGAFQLELKDESQDLFCQVAKEYLIQLNGELLEVYGEMQKYDLVN